MNIQAINGIGFMSKAPITRIKQVGNLDGYSTEMLNRCYGEVESFARNYGKQVMISQKKDSILVNSGPITSTFNIHKLENPDRDFGQNIINNIRANTIANEKGLKKGIEYLEINSPKVGEKLNVVV